MISELLVALDGSVASLRALDVAAAYAERLGAELTPVTVVGRKLDAGPDVLWLDQHTADGGLVVPADDVVEALLELAAEDPGTVLCMTSHGRTGLPEAVLGSVSAAVVRRSPDPVLLIGPQAEPPAEFDVIDVCVGVEEVAARLDGPAREWAAALGATPCHVTVDDDDVPAALAARAAEDHAALTVASTHGRHGIEGVVLGSLAKALVRRSPRAVLLVGPSVVDRDWADAGSVAH